MTARPYARFPIGGETNRGGRTSGRAAADQVAFSSVADDNDLGIDGIGPGTRIGEGGSAIVYRARQDELDRDVAVKVLGFSANDDTRRRFDRERRLMGRLSQHEGMVTVYDTGFNSRGEPYITMPLLGASLADEIRVEPMPWEHATAIIADVCRTVGFAHEQGIVHRDLKPGNIMMSNGGRPLVADFGIARIVDTNTNLEATTLALTPAYSPPEALDTTVAQPTGDVYSLGATLFALITGHPPYCEAEHTPTLMTLMHSIVNDPVPDLGNSAPPEIQAILERSMAKRPADRYQTAVEFADALDAASESLLAERTAPTLLAPPAPDPPDGPSRRRMLLAGGVVVVILGVLAGLVAVLSGDDDDGDAATPATTIPSAAAATLPDDASVPVDTGGGQAATTDAVESTVPVIVIEGGEVFLTPFDQPGDASFTASIAAVADDALMSFVDAGGPVVPAEDTTPAPTDSEDGTAIAGVAGTEDGVFAGSEGVAPCAPDELAGALTPEAPETAAWAEVQQVGIESVPAFIDGLTSVVLTADTRVTDHELVDGMAIPRQAILQVGTAVMVDEFGTPRVRCVSGSPLTPPEAIEDTISYVGVAWDTFSLDETVVVAPAAAPVDEFVLTDIAGGPDFIRPVGSSGADDRPLLPGEVLATGAFTSFAGLDQASLSVNSMDMVFRPEGGDVTGSFAYTLDVQGISLESFGELAGTYDPATGVISGTGFGTTQGGGISQTGEGTWSAALDPVAGTITGQAGDGDVTFALTFVPYTI